MSPECQTEQRKASEAVGGREERRLGLGEFVPLMALATSIDALSIDTMLPALPAMGRDHGVTEPASLQLIVTLMFLGFAVGQLIGGPLADSLGRKRAFYCGLAIYLAGTLTVLFAGSFTVLLAGRVLQGLGASIPLVVLSALVRDQYEGAPMARIMSLIGGVFIMVPIIAPLLGQGILLVSEWRMIFVMFFVLACIVTIWFGLRQPETLPAHRRTPFRMTRFAAAYRDVLSHRIVLGYALIEGLVFGAFLPYLATAQHVFQDIYDQGPYFALYFSSLAGSIGIALFLNSALVMRFGMQRLVTLALAGVAILSAVMFTIALILPAQPPLWLLMGYLLLAFLGIGFGFGNLNALAMEPVGHVAGTAAAAIGSVATAVGTVIGIGVGSLVVGTVLPLIAAFGVLFGLGLCVMRWTEAGRTLGVGASAVSR